MSNTKTESRRMFPFLPVFFCIFVTLKLMGYIDWSWWWVTAPLWIPFAIVVVIMVVLYVSVGAKVVWEAL